MILDTNAVSSMAKEDPGVVAAVGSAVPLALPVLVIGEYRYGIALSQVSVRLAKWFENLIADCLVLEVTNETTRHYAAIRVELRQIGKPIPVNDIWIAALCRQHNFSLLSQDRHFDVVRGLKRVGW